MKRHLYPLVLMLALVVFDYSGATAATYTFTGDVKCLDGTPIGNAKVLVRYVWTVAGELPLEGRSYVYTDANGVFTLSGGIPDVVESVVAWAWVGDKERYRSNCQPGNNYIGYFKFFCGGPEIYYDDPYGPDTNGR